MAIETKQKRIFDAAVGAGNNTPFSDIIAIGTVVDTNDPMQLGRIRAIVPAWGDSWDHEVDAMPWCMYVSPLGGQTHVGTRGPGLYQTEGGIAYGMWGLPKVGAQIVVMSLDEQHIQRLFMGCVYDMNTPHTMPHGRWMYDDHPELDKQKPKSKPYGPYSSREKLIQPLSDNLQKAFGGDNSDIAYEWRTRAADYSVSRVDVSQLSQSYSKVQDDLEVQDKDWTSTQGYQNSRIDPHGNASGKNYDSHTYSWTTPGFHSVSMDDRQENCRMRFRTSSGHQIILDDTNERIYIATAQGNNWIELDQAGNIDIFTTNKVNIRSNQDINLTSDKTIRMHAKEGIHMHSDKEIRMMGKEDIHIKTDKNLRSFSKENTHIQADKKLHIKAKSDLNLSTDAVMNAKSKDEMKLSTGSTLHLKASSEANLTAGGTLNLKAGGNILETGAQIHLNGPGAASASDAGKADKAGEKPALFTNRVPAHEPWARTMTKKDDSHEPELKYDSEYVGRMERGKSISRGSYWRR